MATQKMQLLNLKYLLTDGSFDELSWLELKATFGNVKVYENTLAGSIASVRSSVVSESEADALATADERAALLSSNVIVEDDALPAVQDALAAETSSSTTDANNSSFTKLGENRIEGTISCSSASVVCLSIPNTATWTLTVDGKPVETFRADYGFIGFTLSAGSHEITACYEPANFRLACILSATGAVLTVATAAFVGVSLKRRGAAASPSEPAARHYR